MSQELPQVITIELEEKDVQQDIVTIINGMEAIRQEQIADRNITEEKKNEYLHLTYRLASAIEGIAEEGLVKNIQKVVDAIEKNPELLCYDYLQDCFWKNAEPEFSFHLDKVLIKLKGDDFSGLQDKHHVVNALKYINSKEEPLEKRLNVYDTILPFNDHASDYNEKLFREELKKRGIKSVESSRGLTLRVKNTKNLEKAISAAKSLGFKSVMTVMTHNKYDKLAKTKKYDSMVLDVEHDVYSGLYGRLGNLKIKKIPKILYPIFGAFPKKIKENLEERLGSHNFDSESASNISGGFNAVASLVSVFTSLILLSLDNPPIAGMNLEKSLFWGGLYLFGETLIRSYNDCKIGTLIFSPLNLLHVKKEDNYLVRIDVPTNNQEAISKTVNQKQLEDLAHIKVPLEKEKNLVWSLENHYTFGKYFTESLPIFLIEPPNCASASIPEKDIGALTFYNIFQSQDYKKLSALVCFENNRYALTAISKIKEIPFREIAVELSRQQPTEEKLKRLSKITSAKYLRLSKFESCRKTDDYTVMAE